MALDRVQAFFRAHGMEAQVLVLAASSATVEMAAQALGCAPQRIAKTLSFWVEDQCALIVTAGDARIDNSRFKERFACKARMPSAQEVLEKTGHAVGGVCPFAIPADVPVYLDASLRRFETVFPACGSDNSAIELTIPQLEQYAACADWVDVCKGWRDEEAAP